MGVLILSVLTAVLQPRSQALRCHKAQLQPCCADLSPITAATRTIPHGRPEQERRVTAHGDESWE